VKDRRPVVILGMNTLAFTVCFAVWVMNGVLVTFLVENKVFAFDKAQIGWLLGIPVLSGSIFRLPVGMATDRLGGKVVFPIVLLLAAGGALLASYADGYGSFVAASLLFGLAGTGFAVGIAYTSVWFPMKQQGTALGIFGVGNAGAAITSLLAPTLLRRLTNGGQDLDRWRTFPRIYAAALVVMAIVFVLVARNKTAEHARTRTLRQQLAPLGNLRVWRFGLYYFLVFGAFVALAQWLIPYYLNVYSVSLATAGLLASIYTLPSGLIRALGGWLSDRLGARTVMYWVLGICVLGCLLLVVPRMDITSPGEGVQAAAGGTVTEVTRTEIVIGARRYPIRAGAAPAGQGEEGTLILPTSRFWQEPVVRVGDHVAKKQLLARGVTHIYFQANIWVFTALVFLIGVAMGIGKAAVYKHIPEYFPRDVGVVGGIVGVIGGLGGFVCPILFGYLLRGTGLWTTTWMFLFGVGLVCLVWMHLVVRRMLRARAPHVAEKIDEHTGEFALQEAR
jgi:MFS transporter, NNP family, nitrate/nitrite transporter